MALRLIINADDYGRTPGVSEGIRYAHLHGLVTSTTAMMNMPGVEVALEQALQLCPQLGLGVHLVLTAGAPLLPPERLLSLTGGEWFFPRPLRLIERLATLDVREARVEWRAQIERFVTVTGRAPDHLDSHHHVSYFTPELFQAMLELARDYSCAIRYPLENGVFDPGDDLPPERLQEMAQAGPELLARFPVPHPDHFTTAFYDEMATRDYLLDLLTHLPAGTTEIMCHPGYADDELLHGSSYNRQRERELAALTDGEVKDFVQGSGIELISFGRLGKPVSNPQSLSTNSPLPS